ncbi:MAG TPA: hypothetical protein PK159_03215 [Steroidobacteraceae bacterium]|nr:hypothetical protein [Steroidobacteraceae bacterium]
MSRFLVDGAGGCAWLATLALLALAGCGGGGSSGGGGTLPPQPTDVVVSGRITFDRVPIGGGAGQGLDFAAVVLAPARAVTVEALAAANSAVLASTVTNDTGNYSLSLAPNTNVLLRVKAEMVRTGAPSWSFRVRNNTNGNALYALDGTSFNTGTTNSQRDLHAASGWGGAGYTTPRAAAPFAILDTVYQAYTLVLGAEPGASFPPLDLFWSTTNRVGTGGCAVDRPSIASGVICTTFYLAPVANPAASRPDAGIYVLGSANDDSDEFDRHVIAHEWGHYYQDSFSRDDSIGGPHGFSDRLDPRLAFSEGWGNAFSGMVVGDRNYRDSFAAGGQQRSFGFDLESNPGASAASIGWYSESSIQSLLWDFFDDAPDGLDTVALGFAPIHRVMANEVRTAAAFSTVYPFVEGLRTRAPASDGAIEALVRAQQISTQRGDPFGTAEANNGGDPRNLPIYRPILPGTTERVCSTVAPNGPVNKLGVARFLRFDLAASRNVTVDVRGPASSPALPDADPDVYLFRAGLPQAAGNAVGINDSASLPSAPAGAYLIEVHEYSNVDPPIDPQSGQPKPRGETCIDVTLSAN